MDGDLGLRANTHAWDLARNKVRRVDAKWKMMSKGVDLGLARGFGAPRGRRVEKARGIGTEPTI